MSATSVECRRVCVNTPLVRVDEDDGEIGGGGAGDHVAGVLFMTGRVGDDEAPGRGREIAIGDIDGDALLALGGEAIEQQREVEPRASGLRIRFERGELIGVQEFRIVKQAAEQRRLAIIDRTAGDETQEGLALNRDRLFRLRGGASKIALPLLLLHRRALIEVDDAAAGARCSQQLWSLR